ncbi:MAG: bifunctional diguanylate cyclase/phosphodiesterase [Lachnobacterium sp.]|nr:bifunctional diguanylate cyclase/phosphodiesterase [Lachnobacterium sp.]MDY5461416.1 bifunctional diguanylate cyclase/phosphodiesterase [Agathobacter sp.]
MANSGSQSAKEYQQGIAKYDNGLIDSAMLQQLQDQFCRANNLYLVCLGREEGVITKAYGSREELSFLHSLVDKQAYMSLIMRAEHDWIETMLEQQVGHACIKMCSIATRLEEKVEVIWVVIGILRDAVPEGVELPEYMMTTTEKSFYASTEFLASLSAQLFEVKINQLIAQDAMKKSLESENEMKHQLHRSQAMTEVVRMLESDEGFSELTVDILRETCESLDLSGGFLIRENVDHKTTDMICEYVKNKEDSLISGFQKKEKVQLPFFNGKPYMISSDSMMPEAFERFFRENDLSAAVFQPLEVSDHLLMYVGFFEKEAFRVWESDDIKFISGVKRVIQSILLKRIAKNSLASSYASLEAILENAGCGIYVVDYHTRSILYTNQKLKDLFSRTIKAGKLEEIVFAEEEEKKTHYYDEVYFVEEERWLDVHKTEIDWVDGRKVGLCTLYDITDKKLYQKKIENQANNDFLTGLYNRMRCEQDLGRYIAKAQAVNCEGALLYIDLDDFKHINDGLGHQYGDVLLKAISHSLQRIEGIENSCYRMGGDEFIVIISEAVYPQMERILRDIDSIFSKPWFLKGEDYYCTMSMGIACFPSDGNSVDDLIRKADMALMTAKRRGKNCVEYYNDKDQASTYRRLDMEKNMRTAAMNACKEFEVYYQPIVNAQEDGTPCCGAEALIRWNSSVLGFVSPEDFIPLAEYLGLINPIGEFVLQEAAKRCKYWNDMGHPNYKVNVNLSVVQLLQNDIIKKIKKVIDDTRINPRNLTLEVTESLAINDMEHMKRILSEIKALGVKVALDDFGTGYSSLNHIREMPIDVIKIDRCFIEHLGEDDFSDAFVKMVNELANTIGVKVCVEGVETKKQLDVACDMKVCMIQGYYFGKPMKIEDFEKKYL